METEQIRVLLVDDDQGDFEMIRVMLSQAEHGNYKLDWVGSFEEALDAFKSNQHDVYLLDYFLEDRTGLDLLKEAEEHGVSAPIIMLTGRGSSKVDLEAMEAGAADYLVKGTFDPDGLERAIRYSLDRGGSEGTRADGAVREGIPAQTGVEGEVIEDVALGDLFGAEGRFRAVFTATPSPVALVDLDGLLLDVNPAFTQMFFSPTGEIEGSSYVELLERSDQAPVLREIGALSRGEKIWVEGHRRFQAHDGGPVDARTSTFLIRAKSGEPDHLVVVLREVG